MSASLTGGCACGAVRYVVSGRPTFSFHCCCRKCQRQTGGGHASAFVVKRNEIALTGPLRYFEQPSDSGYPTRAGFCPTCGSPVLNIATRFPDSRYIHAGSLDEPSRFTPEGVVFRAEAPPWDHLDPALA